MAELPPMKTRDQIQRAHDILHFLCLNEGTVVFDSEGQIACGAVHDALAWVLGFPCGEEFAVNLAKIQATLRDQGYEEIDMGRPLAHEEVPEGLR